MTPEAEATYNIGDRVRVVADAPPGLSSPKVKGSVGTVKDLSVPVVDGSSSGAVYMIDLEEQGTWFFTDEDLAPADEQEN